MRERIANSLLHGVLTPLIEVNTRAYRACHYTSLSRHVSHTLHVRQQQFTKFVKLRVHGVNRPKVNTDKLSWFGWAHADNCHRYRRNQLTKWHKLSSFPRMCRTCNRLLENEFTKMSDHFALLLCLPILVFELRRMRSIRRLLTLDVGEYIRGKSWGLSVLPVLNWLPVRRRVQCLQMPTRSESGLKITIRRICNICDADEVAKFIAICSE